MGVFDNNPPYGSFSFAGSYSSPSKVADAYWADFLFGTTSAYSLAGAFEAHLRQTLDSAYVQDDWKVSSQPDFEPRSALGVRLTLFRAEQLRFQLGSGTQTVLTINPKATAGNGITPTTGSGVYGKTLMNPDLNDFAPRVGFAWALTSKDRPSAADSAPAMCTTRAPAPATFSPSTPAGAICRRQPDRANHNQSLFHAASRPDHCHGNHNSHLLRYRVPGLPVGTGYQLQSRHR